MYGRYMQPVVTDTKDNKQTYCPFFSRLAFCRPFQWIPLEVAGCVCDPVPFKCGRKVRKEGKQTTKAFVWNSLGITTISVQNRKLKRLRYWKAVPTWNCSDCSLLADVITLHQIQIIFKNRKPQLRLCLTTLKGRFHVLGHKESRWLLCYPPCPLLFRLFVWGGRE